VTESSGGERQSGPHLGSLSSAVRSLESLLTTLKSTYVERTDRVLLRSALDELCQHRPDLRRECDRAFALAQTCSLPIESPERVAAIDKLKQMVRAIARACAET